MFAIGWMELLLLLVCGGFILLPTLLIVVVLLTRRRAGDAAPVTAAQSPPRSQVAATPVSDDADSRQSIVARLTQRFCPQCRAPLAADSPEGLCPACLLAGGMASAVHNAAEGRNATEGVPDSADGLAVTTPPSGSQPPIRGEWADLQRHFPDLEILELLGQGGMGSVYKARQKNLDRVVALKVIPPEAAKDPAFLERFAREARAMARLNHPNIVTVYNYGTEGALCWLLMEYVDGVNLRHALRANRLAPREALAIVPQICDALQFAHDQGVVHRDIKPENVLLDRSGRVKIADFGLAKLLGKGPDDYTLTRTQQVMGTPRYMAPEQIERPTTVDHRADIYSLGVVIYEMLTGELPLGRFEPPSHKVAVDVRIDQVVLRTLEKEPERRYQRASQLKTELASAVSWPQAAVSPPAATPLPPQPSWHTPAPATKASPAAFPDGVPPAAVLGVAIGMVIGVLMMTAGLAAALYGLVTLPGEFGEAWGWIGGGFGCLIGGAGSLFGSYNSYRQMTGSEDLMRSPNVTWFDWVMRGYFLLGILLIVAGLWDFPDGNPAHPNWPCFLLGAIASFQAGLFLIWRALTRPAGRAGALSAQAAQSQPAEPGFVRAVLLPTAAVLAVLGVLGLDLAYTMPDYSAAGGVTRSYSVLVEWSKHLVVAGFILVPLCLAGMGAWYAFGPRVETSGKARLAHPFAARAWLWGVAALAIVALVVPWFRLEVAPGGEVVLPVHRAFTPTADVALPPPSEGLVSVVVKEAELRNIGEMPRGFRYAHRGMDVPLTAAACLLIAFAAVLATFIGAPGNGGRGVVLCACGLIGFFLMVMLLHQTLDGPQWLTIDRRTETGLVSYLTRLKGEHPLVETVLPALREGYVARPALGTLLALVAMGACLFVGVTDLSWGSATGSASAAAASAAAKSPPLDPAREAIRRRVAGPAIGLMIAGAISLLPFLLALILIPTVTLVTPSRFVPSPGPPVIERSEPAKISLLLPAANFAAVTGNAPLAATTAVPVLIAQEMPAPQRDHMPTWTILMPLLALFYLFNLVISITLIIAGWRMRKLKSYGLSMVAAIVALLPCSFGWFIGLPMGIWALLVLQRPEVREAFEA